MSSPHVDARVAKAEVLDPAHVASVIAAHFVTSVDGQASLVICGA
jgi:hypothetical protein